MIIVFFYILFTSLFFQQTETQIRWTADQKLIWSDFEATPDNSIEYDALTNWQISYSASYSSDQGLEYEVHCFFNKDKSWKKDESASDHLLAHEQLHFDIAELYARKLRKVLESYKVKKNIEKEINKLFEMVLAECNKDQKQYDKESDHSNDKEVQSKWIKRISKEIKELNSFTYEGD